MKEANIVLSEYFIDEDLQITFNHNEAIWDITSSNSLRRDIKLKHPEIFLSIRMREPHHGSDTIRRPQSFLNEGRLSLISIAIRIAIKRLKTTDSPIKLLVLDDLLLSLDMSNRLKNT